MTANKIGNALGIINFQRVKFLVVCLLCGIFIILPQLVHRYPDLLDVAETVSYKQENLISNIQQSFVEQDRFRPLYSAVRVIVSKTFGYNERYYFISHGILIGLTMFMILNLASPNQWLVLMPLVFLLFISPYTVDAYWRLGTAEPIMGFLLIGSYVLFVKRKYVWLIVFLSLGALSKETFIVYFPVFLYGLRMRGQKNIRILLRVIFITYFLLLLPRVLLALSGGQSYPAAIALHPNNISGMVHVILKYFVIAYPLLLVTGIISFFLVKFRLNDKKEIRMILLLLIAGLVPIILTNNVQFYYLLPTLITLCALCVLTADKLIIMFKTRHAVIGLYIVVIICSLLLIGHTVKRAVFWFNDYTGDNTLIAWILSDSRRYSRISLEGRLEYYNALRFMLNDPLLSKNYIRRGSYTCETQTDGYSVKCNIAEPMTTQLAARITQAEIGKPSFDLCSMDVLLHEKVCKWYIDVTPL